MSHSVLQSTTASSNCNVTFSSTVNDSIFKLPNNIHEYIHVNCSFLDGFRSPIKSKFGKVSVTQCKGSLFLIKRRRHPMISIIWFTVIIDKHLCISKRTARDARNHLSLYGSTELLYG